MRAAGREAMALTLRAAVPICRQAADCLPAAPAQGSDLCEESDGDDSSGSVEAPSMG